MVAEVDNGRSTNYCKKIVDICNESAEGSSSQISAISYISNTTDIKINPYKYDSDWWMQFKILLLRMWLQMWRDKVRKSKLLSLH